MPGEGPEDVVVGQDGVIYTGLVDARVLAVAPDDGAVREVANTGGRPLGLEATADGRLLICDSPKGLLELDLKTGALKTLVSHDGAEPIIAEPRCAVAIREVAPRLQLAIAWNVSGPGPLTLRW